MCHFSPSHYKSPFKEKSPSKAWGVREGGEQAHFLPVYDGNKMWWQPKKNSTPVFPQRDDSTLTPPIPLTPKNKAMNSEEFDPKQPNWNS